MDYVALQAELLAMQAKLRTYAEFEENIALHRHLKTLHDGLTPAIKQAQYLGKRPLRKVNDD